MRPQPTKENFAVLILTHGRANNVATIATLQKSGYTGRIVIVIDNEDAQAEDYYRNFGDQVVMFDKLAVAEYTDEGYHDHQDRRSITYARNAAFTIAKDLGLQYFMMLDDDYVNFQYRFNDKQQYCNSNIKNLDAVLDAMLTFYVSINAHSIAFAQGGDFMGGGNGTFGKKVTLKRKCMNTFICDVDRPYLFRGVFNEDVNTYTTLSQQGCLFFTLTNVIINQKETQSNPGGITELYQKFGTYVKSFYTVMYSPSSVKIAMMNSSHSRIHHEVRWKNTAPKILHQRHKKTQ
ncbi:hypothetical protein [Spirosoma sp.]|uniref:GREB1-related protein n=1 Tax=Spirosoma sp. TaxID=1899569 RepID=UPI00261DFBEC|nr:hypothetical protein [Spirosoma sp.]MCX6217643.1 hypothetical protein [Spirosoma sp.]